jgi:hypothetical protein
MTAAANAGQVGVRVDGRVIRVIEVLSINAMVDFDAGPFADAGQVQLALRVAPQDALALFLGSASPLARAASCVSGEGRERRWPERVTRHRPR